MWLGDKKWVIAFAVKSKRKGYYLAVQLFLPIQEAVMPDLGWTDEINMDAILESLGESDPKSEFSACFHFNLTKLT